MIAPRIVRMEVSILVNVLIGQNQTGDEQRQRPGVTTGVASIGVQTQFTYLDVGVNIDVTPTIDGWRIQCPASG